MIVVFAPHGSACARLSSTSSAAFVSPYGPSLPNAPWLGESGSRTVRGVELADQPLDAEQLEPDRGLERRARLVRVAGGGQRGERREDRRRERVDAQVVAAAATAAGVAQPVRERVDVGERREVGGHDVQLGLRAGARAVQLAVEAPPLGRERGGRDHDLGAAAQEPLGQLRADRVRRRAGDQRRLVPQVRRDLQRHRELRDELVREVAEQVDRPRLVGLRARVRDAGLVDRDGRPRAGQRQRRPHKGAWHLYVRGDDPLEPRVRAGEVGGGLGHRRFTARARRGGRSLRERSASIRPASASW